MAFMKGSAESKASTFAGHQACGSLGKGVDHSPFGMSDSAPLPSAPSSAHMVVVQCFMICATLLARSVSSARTTRPRFSEHHTCSAGCRDAGCLDPYIEPVTPAKTRTLAVSKFLKIFFSSKSPEQKTATVETLTKA